MDKELIIIALNRLLGELRANTLELSDYILVDELLQWYEVNRHFDTPPSAYADRLINYHTRWEMCEGYHQLFGFSFRTFCNVMHVLEEGGGYKIETNRIYFPMKDYVDPEPI